MTRRVVVVRKGASVEEALRLMAHGHVSGLPVVDVAGKVIGMITESDVLLRGQHPVESDDVGLPGVEAPGDDRVTAAYRKGRATRVEDAMSSRVIAFGPQSSVSDIARVMIERGINRVPIIDGERLVGIISRGDIIRSMAAMPVDADQTSDDGRILIEGP